LGLGGFLLERGFGYYGLFISKCYRGATGDEGDGWMGRRTFPMLSRVKRCIQQLSNLTNVGRHGEVCA
jgi:hypothetical protein